MKIFDFEYDGKRLSDFGFIFCSFDETYSNLNTLSNGSKIQFKTVQTQHKSKEYAVDFEYTEVLSATWTIAKNPCDWNDNLEISYDEIRELGQWLCRKEFLDLSLKNESYEDFYTKAYFNMSVIEMGDKVYGIELEVITNSPFLYLAEKHIELDLTGANASHLEQALIQELSSEGFNCSDEFRDLSDDYGSKYPDKVEIIIPEDFSDQPLLIKNMQEKDRVIEIKNCESNETITMEYPVIYSSNENHKICNDFNWSFLRVNQGQENLNIIVSNQPIMINITYSPAIKVGII